jgi:hypothetical protein
MSCPNDGHETSLNHPETEPIHFDGRRNPAIGANHVTLPIGPQIQPRVTTRAYVDDVNDVTKSCDLKEAAIALRQACGRKAEEAMSMGLRFGPEKIELVQFFCRRKGINSNTGIEILIGQTTKIINPKPQILLLGMTIDAALTVAVHAWNAA